MKLPAEADSLLLRHLVEQCVVGVAVSATENVDVSRGGGHFRLPWSNNGVSFVYHPTCRLRVVPILAARHPDLREVAPSILLLA